MQTTHGMSASAEYRIWRGMKTRCLNPNSAGYADYGSKGIGFDPRWGDFSAFLSDMGPRPTPQHTLERKDGTKGYTSDNCVWALREEQNNNKANNVRITINGTTKTAVQWAREHGLGIRVVWSRFRSGKTGEDLIAPAKRVLGNPSRRGGTETRKTSRFLSAHGKTQTLAQWARSLGVSGIAISNRIKKGWSEEKALTTPFKKQEAQPPVCSKCDRPSWSKGMCMMHYSQMWREKRDAKSDVATIIVMNGPFRVE